MVEKAVAEVCKALGVAVPEKGQRVRGKVNGEKDSKEEKRVKEKEGEAVEGVKSGKEVRTEKEGKSTGKAEEQLDEEQEEKAISQLDKLLGLDSDADSGDADSEEEGVLVKGRTKRPASAMELDPMEITTDEEAGGTDEELDLMDITTDEEGSGSEAEFNGFSDEGNQSSASDDEASDAESSASSISRSPPAKKAATKKAPKPLKTTDSTFLPTLMGGYISGSESASDVDVAPERRNRRGQRARQQIWEKKFGEKAKHLVEPKTRDSGWDLKRGAVGGDSKPWKRGVRNPLLDKSKGTGANETRLGKEPPAPRTRDDTGPLHPSWEAKKRAKEKEQQTAAYEGKRITFD